jgi:Fic family protein
MKIPHSPPLLDDLLRKYETTVEEVLGQRIGPEVEGVYEHWDHLRHLTPPKGLNVEQWWMGIKLARAWGYQDLPLRDKFRRPLRFVTTDCITRILHFMDREAAGSIQGLDRNEDPQTRQRYLIRSLMEEAMTSAQLEGATTTHRIAKEMLSSGRRPRDRSERMIYNNYATMQRLKHWCSLPLTPNTILEMHRMLTQDTLDHADEAGRFRRKDEDIVVVDRSDRHILHRPPPADELPGRIAALCELANDDGGRRFLHPVVRAIALHYQMGYDHPFTDGNGRTARALFYWSMLRSGYWATEFLSISAVLKSKPAQYQRAYLYTETDAADLSYFIAHQLHVLEQAMQGLRGYISRKVAERREAEAVLHPASKFGQAFNHRQRALLLHAVRNPGEVYRIAMHRHSHQISYPTARSDLMGLADAGLFRQRKVGKEFTFTADPHLAKRLEGKVGRLF